MSSAQKGAFIKLMAEFAQSPRLVEFLNHMQSQGVSEIEIHFDNKMHHLDGKIGPFETLDTSEQVEWEKAPNQNDETDLKLGTKVVISINSNLVHSDTRFVELVIHALGHPYMGISEADEAWLRTRESTIREEIFNTPGATEATPPELFGRNDNNW
jgi:hypothetical protein